MEPVRHPLSPIYPCPAKVVKAIDLKKGDQIVHSDDTPQTDPQEWIQFAGVVEDVVFAPEIQSVYITLSKQDQPLTATAASVFLICQRKSKIEGWMMVIGLVLFILAVWLLLKKDKPRWT